MYTTAGDDVAHVHPGIEEGLGNVAAISNEPSEAGAAHSKRTCAEEAVQDRHLSITKHMLDALDERRGERGMAQVDAAPDAAATEPGGSVEALQGDVVGDVNAERLTSRTQGSVHS